MPFAGQYEQSTILPVDMHHLEGMKGPEPFQLETVYEKSQEGIVAHYNAEFLLYMGLHHDQTIFQELGPVAKTPSPTCSILLSASHPAAISAGTIPGLIAGAAAVAVAGAVASASAIASAIAGRRAISLVLSVLTGIVLLALPSAFGRFLSLPANTSDVGFYGTSCQRQALFGKGSVIFRGGYGEYLAYLGPAGESLGQKIT
jgi:hypothetical protein